MSATITPTVGRIVWFKHYLSPKKPLAAMICHVHSDTSVNLAVFSLNGVPEARQNVRLVQPGETVDLKGEEIWCQWMPYQVKKTTGSESGEPAVGTESI